MKDPGRLLEGVRRAYSAAAERPLDVHPFPVGRSFAESVGYPQELLSRLPAVAVEAFSGVSCVSLFTAIPPGSSMLDLGCGAGLDCLIAAERTGSRGKVIGVDFSEAMLARASDAVAQAGAGHAEIRWAFAGALPIESGTIDVVLANGILDLNPERGAILRELAWAVRAGGEVYAAELVLREPLPPGFHITERTWFA